MKKQKYTIGIPAYNEESSIIDCLNSIVEASKHTREELREIIVCLNACTDDTERLVKEWRGFSRTKVIRSKPGYINAINKLTKYVKDRHPDDIYIKTDGDCTLDKLSLKLVLDQLDKHPNLLIAGGHPYPVLTKNKSIYRRILAKTFSVRSREPSSEVATNEVSAYHAFADIDPIPGINDREKKLKIYFHGRLWAIRAIKLLPLLPMNVIGEDVYIPGWFLKHYGKKCIRLDYRARVYFKPNDSLARHWKVYRRIKEDRSRVYAMPGFEEYANNCPLRLDWPFIIQYTSKAELPYFALYWLITTLENLSFKMIDYDQSFWTYKEKEV